MSTITTKTGSLPEIQQTLPGRSREYRLFTVEHVDYDDLRSTGAGMVVVGGWGISYTSVIGEGPKTTISAYYVAGDRTAPFPRHEIDKRVYPDPEAARKDAFDHGLLAFMVYENER